MTTENTRLMIRARLKAKAIERAEFQTQAQREAFEDFVKEERQDDASDSYSERMEDDYDERDDYR